jgi:hypothetical protein
VVVENGREQARVGGCRHFKAQMALRAGCERSIVCDVVQNDSTRVWWGRKTALCVSLAMSANGSAHLFKSGLSALRGGISSALEFQYDVLPVPSFMQR